VELGAVAAPAEVAERLRLDPRDQALIRRRRMYADDEPMQLATSYVPWSLAEGTQMTTEDTGPGGLYSRLADAGHRPARFTEEVAIRMASEDESRFLNLPAPEPVFYLVRTAFDDSGRPVEICEHIMPGDRWELTYEWPPIKDFARPTEALPSRSHSTIHGFAFPGCRLVPLMRLPRAS
jgi:GntR family transcriptional regulator